MLTIEGRAAALFERACREPLLHRSDRERGPQLDDVAIRSRDKGRYERHLGADLGQLAKNASA